MLSEQMAPILPKLYGITGYPLGHSASPVLQSWNFAQIGHTASYHVWPKTAEQLPAFIAAVRALPIDGLSVTIPHKQAIIPLLDAITDTAKAAGAVNTLYWEGAALMGHNTDVEGFLAPLAAAGKQHFPTVLILGAGGAARAVASALAGCTEEMTICARDILKAKKLATLFAAETLAWNQRTEYKASLIVNTTPLGMQGVAAGQNPFGEEDFLRMEQQGIAYDLVYSPLDTPFLQAAAAAGWQIHNGLAMLAAQGVAQCRLWAGTAPLWNEAYTMLQKNLADGTRADLC